MWVTASSADQESLQGGNDYASTVLITTSR